MKKIIIITIFLASVIFPQNTYYISISSGNDNNSGTTESQPFRTITKLNSIELEPGDKILFKKGDIWNEPLVLKNSGTSQNNIVLDSYGTGNKPIITSRTEVTGWKDASNWEKASDVNNVWKMDLESNRSINRMFLNNEDARWASDYKLKSWVPYFEIEGVTLPNVLNKGDNGDGTVGVCKEHPFYHDKDKGILYLYATTNPASFYSNIELPGLLLEGKEVYATIHLMSDYITLNALDIQGGMYASVALSGADYIRITNCDIGKYTNWAALSGDSREDNDKTSDYVTVSNCVIDSDWRFDYIFYNGMTPYGIRISASSYWDVNNCLIKDWWMSFLILGDYSASQYNKIHDNEITSNCAYGKALQVVSGAKFRSYYGTTDKTYLSFYNNYIHDIVFGIQITSQYNYFYYNIFENMTIESVNEHGGGGGYASSAIEDPTNSIYPDYAGDPRHNYFFNNTFINLRDHAHIWDGNSKYYYLNNLYISCGKEKNGAVIKITNTHVNGYYYNNLLYFPDFSVSSNLVRLTDSKLGIDEPHTVSWLNNINNLYSNKHSSGNLQHVGSQSTLINNDFSLPTGSPALNSGTDISSYIPSGFKDRFGNTVNRTNPNIGAYAGNNSSVTSDINIQVLKPNGGEILTANSSQEIAWNSSEKTTQVHVFYSLDNGVNWTQIASAQNNGSVNWVVPNVYSDQCIVRVKDANNFSVVDRSDNPFSILPAPIEYTDPPPATELKVFLEAPFTQGNMENSLNKIKAIPKEHPFNLNPWNINDSSSITNIESNYVDWILIELRDEMTNKKYAKPAILTNSGNVVNIDGSSLSFSNIVSGEYYIVVNHRNHLGIMSSKKIMINNNQPVGYDFTDSQSKAYGTSSMIMLEDGHFGLYAGDSDANGVINNLDMGLVANNIPFRGYSRGDLDMNGMINVLDYSIISKNIFKKTNVPRK